MLQSSLFEKPSLQRPYKISRCWTAKWTTSITSLDNETKNLLLIHIVQEEIHVLNDSTLFQYGAAVLSLVTGAMENENEYDIWGVEFLEDKNDNNTWKKSFVYKEEDIK